MAQEMWVNTTGSTWKKVTEVYVNTTGSTWKKVTEGYVNTTGSTWKQFFASIACDDGTLDTVGTTWADTGGTLCTSCAANYCAYCVKLIWTDCDDACHNIDGALSTNGGSYVNSLSCTSKACDFDGGCSCNAGGSYQFSCDITKNCVDDNDDYQARLILQLDSDSSTVDTIYGTSKTGICVA